MECVFDLAQGCVGGEGQLQAILEVDRALESHVQRVPQHPGSQPGKNRRYSTVFRIRVDPIQFRLPDPVL